jgi:hypothetical protein
LRAAKNAMARVIAENYLRCFVSQLSCHRNEKDTTRARANALREYLTHSERNKFDHEELYKVFELCVVAKRAPANVPVMWIAAMKSGFLYQYQKQMGFMAQ